MGNKVHRKKGPPKKATKEKHRYHIWNRRIELDTTERYKKYKKKIQHAWSPIRSYIAHGRDAYSSEWGPCSGLVGGETRAPQQPTQRLQLVTGERDGAHQPKTIPLGDQEWQACYKKNEENKARDVELRKPGPLPTVVGGIICALAKLKGGRNQKKASVGLVSGGQGLDQKEPAKNSLISIRTTTTQERSSQERGRGSGHFPRGCHPLTPSGTLCPNKSSYNNGSEVGGSGSPPVWCKTVAVQGKNGKINARPFTIKNARAGRSETGCKPRGRDRQARGGRWCKSFFGLWGGKWRKRH